MERSIDDKLLHISREIEKISRDLPDINWGGCGTFSYHLSKAMKENHGIDSEIFYLPGAPAAVEYDILFSHIAIKAEGYVIDNGGFYDARSKEGWVRDLVPLPYEKLEEMVGMPELWNSRFYRKENIEELIERLNKI
jgi:hypothetical protein